jgi:hypothetical protein
MRATIAISAIVAFSVPARAEPDHACAVRVVRAPAEIRAEIERWLAGESSCNVALEVRVVPTEGGYYLLARDVHGRVRERVVPDGASAGVLVASWASDDQLGPDDPAPNIARPPELDGDDDDTPVSVAPSVISPPSLAIAARSAPSFVPTTTSKWLRVDVLDNIAGIAGTGFRADVDVWQRHGWSAGLAASIANGQQSTNSDYGPTPMSMRDIDALAYVAHTGNVLSWLHVRGALAAGARFTTVALPQITDDNGHPLGASGVRATVDASLLAGAELGHGWAFEVGVLVDAVPQMDHEVEVMFVTYTGPYDLYVDRTISVQLFGGLAHRL